MTDPDPTPSEAACAKLLPEDIIRDVLEALLRLAYHEGNATQRAPDDTRAAELRGRVLAALSASSRAQDTEYAMAPALDLINTWSRELGIPECGGAAGLHAQIGRVWDVVGAARRAPAAGGACETCAWVLANEATVLRDNDAVKINSPHAGSFRGPTLAAAVAAALAAARGEARGTA